MVFAGYTNILKPGYGKKQYNTFKSLVNFSLLKSAECCFKLRLIKVVLKLGNHFRNNSWHPVSKKQCWHQQFNGGPGKNIYTFHNGITTT